jgi:N6-adenosine-specific RNA methylase IME4
MFEGLPRNHFGVVYCDPPWRFEVWSGKGKARSADNHYDTMTLDEMKAMPVVDLAAPDCVLFMWVVWPMLQEALDLISSWSFAYKTCAFAWVKADASQVEMFRDDIDPYMGMGYWSRANSECCLLATRGAPKRLNADVLQAIVEPRREHSRKPSCMYDRIERLVAGPFVELFARTERPGWSCWGNQTDRFK